MRKYFKQSEKTPDTVPVPIIPILDDSFTRLNSEALMQNYAMKTSQMNQNRGKKKLFTSKDEILMNELESNALKLERARRGV
jgi:hypothetical protein